MEDDIDIYADLPSFETKDCQANKELTEECLKLNEENTKLKEDVVKLGANMSSLMKTAKAEIARKDRMIAQLRQELDNAAFRRGNYSARRQKNINNHKPKKSFLCKEAQSEENTEKTQQTPPIKEETLQENVAMVSESISDVEDVEDPVPSGYQDKLTSTVFGARLKNKLLLEQEAERKKKEEARIALLAIPIKVENSGDTELVNGNGFIKKEDPEDVSKNTSNVLTVKMEIDAVSSLPHSSARISQLPEEGDDPDHHRAPKRNFSETQDFSANSELPKRRRVEEKRYSREDDARHHNGNFESGDVHYKSSGFDHRDHLKTSTKYTNSRRTTHNRDDYDRARHKMREERSKSIYRSNAIESRYNGRRSDRHTMEESRSRNDKYERRRENGRSREGDNNWSEYSGRIDEVRDKIESRVGGRSEYNYNSHHQLGWNLKRLRGTSHSSDKSRSHSSSRGSSEKEFDKRRSRRSRSTDKFINAKNTMDEREFCKERRSTREKNSKDSGVEVGTDLPNKTTINEISSKIAENSLLLCTEETSHVDIGNSESVNITAEKLLSQVKTPNGRIATLKNDSREASIESRIPEPAPLDSGSSREEKRREHGSSKKGDNNGFENSREIDELRDNIEKKVGGRTRCKSRSPEKYKNHGSSRKSREKESDKHRSKISTSTDKFINPNSTENHRESGKELQSTRTKNSKDIEVENKNSNKVQPEVPSDLPRNESPNEVGLDKMSCIEVVDNGSDHINIKNAESPPSNAEKIPSQVEISDGRIVALENDSEVASIYPPMPEAAALGSALSGKEKHAEDDINSTERSTESDERRDKFESIVGDSGEGNIHDSLKRLGNKLRSPEKCQSHSNSSRSKEKEFDKRQSRGSRSADKFVNATSTEVDEQESRKERQSTQAKVPKDIDVEMKNSCDAQTEVPPDLSSNDPPKEVAIDKISSSEIVENGLSTCIDELGHVDSENAESTSLTLEKIESIAVLENDSQAASVQSAIPEAPTLGSESFRKEKRQEGVDNCVEHSTESDELRDKFKSNVSGKTEYNHYNSHHPSNGNLKTLGGKSRSPEKDTSHSCSERSQDKDSDMQRSKRSSRSTSTDKSINPKSAVDRQESEKELQSSRVTDSKDLEVEIGSSCDAQQEIAPDLSENNPPNKVAVAKISSSEIAKNDVSLCTVRSDHVGIENADSARVTLEKIVSQVETPDRWIADLENDSEVASIQSAIAEPPVFGSGSFREEKIENIEKFINDYQENEEPCLPMAEKESKETKKLDDSTSSIVNALSMDVEESAVDEKSDNVTKNPSAKSRTHMKDVAGDTNGIIPKPDMRADECTISVQLKTPDNEKVSDTSEISEKNSDRGKHLTDNVALPKLMKSRPRLPCAPIISRYSKRKQSVLTDSGSSNCVVQSQFSTNNEEDNNLQKEIKIQRISTEEPSVQSSRSNEKESDGKISISEIQVEDANILTLKNSTASPTETKETTQDSRAREEDDRTVENSNINSVSVSSSRNNIFQKDKTNPGIPTKVEVAAKPNNVEETVELRETHLTQKTTPATGPSTDSRLTNRKKVLPKEVDGRTKPAVKQCNIIITARRKRPVQLEDSCIARTLIPSVPNVNRNESVRTVCAKAEAPELPKLVSESAIRGRKRRMIDK